MRFRTLAVLVSMMVLFLSPLATHASYAKYTLDDLAAQSDMIVIGKTAGLSGEYRQDGFQYSIWGVDVDYYLKGNPRSSNIKVITPGTKEVVTSVSYDLGPLNGYNLLFLRKVGRNLYIPMSIAGKVLLEKTPDNSYNTENQEIQNFIEKSTLKKPTANRLSISAIVLLIVIYMLLILEGRSKRSLNAKAV